MLCTMLEKYKTETSSPIYISQQKFLVTEKSKLVDHAPRIRKILSPAHFSYEEIRRATFDSWTYDYINKDELAKAGFYYMKNSDHVQCQFCKGVIGYWEHDDRPFREHGKHFPRCPLVQGALTSNIPRVSGEQKNDLHEILNNHLLTSLTNCIPASSHHTLEIDAMIGDQTRLAYPHYKSQDKRIYSLTNWPNENVPPIEKMAAAGFFYTGISDFVLCYYCGGGLFNWRRGDDPWSDHAKYYGHCPLLGSNKIDTKKSLNICLNAEEEELLLKYPISQKLLDLGLSHQSIKSALKEYLEKFWHLPETFMDCTDVVVEWEEKNRKPSKHETDEVNERCTEMEEQCDGHGLSLSNEGLLS